MVPKQSDSNEPSANNQSHHHHHHHHHEPPVHHEALHPITSVYHGHQQGRQSLHQQIPPVGFQNAAFVDDHGQPAAEKPADLAVTPMDAEEGQQNERETWGNPVEFLMSCISMSVGLGNIWRFPYVAYNNGGGAFLIPYLIVLLVIGKPLYFLEMALGQFSSYGSVKVWEVVPILKGVGYGQAMATWFVVTFYCVLISIAIYYLFASMQAVLPWTICDAAWDDLGCFASAKSALDHTAANATNTSGLQSSSALYFKEEVMKLSETIDDGIGSPDWKLTLCLLLSWIIIVAILMKGVQSSGKVAYFTALFPYVVLITLLVRGVTLAGASQGILYYITPDWTKLLDAKTWFAAVGQCFFSLSVGFGPIIMFSSYNAFRQNIYRDAMIISLMDTMTSFLGGVTIFAILGHLAHESGKPISEVVSAGTGLAFVSYPEAIAKFDYVPQLFAVLFFVMLLTLGIGSAVSLTGCVVTIICDDFPHWKRWAVVSVVGVVGFICGLVYITPGGLIIMDIVGTLGGDFIIYLLVVIETIGICWIYGLNRILRDIEFMLGMKLSWYWKLTWAYVIPAVLIFIFCYAMATYEPLHDGDYVYPAKATGFGWFLAAFALLQVPLWGAYVVYQQDGDSVYEKLCNSLKPSEYWGPRKADDLKEWKEFRELEDGTGYSSRVWIPKLSLNKLRSRLYKM